MLLAPVPALFYMLLSQKLAPAKKYSTDICRVCHFLHLCRRELKPLTKNISLCLSTQCPILTAAILAAEEGRHYNVRIVYFQSMQNESLSCLRECSNVPVEQIHKYTECSSGANTFSAICRLHISDSRFSFQQRLNVSKLAKRGLLYTQTGTPYYAR